MTLIFAIIQPTQQRAYQLNSQKNRSREWRHIMRFIEPLQKIFPRAFDHILSDKRMPEPQEEPTFVRPSSYLFKETETPPFQRPIEFRFREFQIGSAHFKVWAQSLGKLEVLAKYLREHQKIMTTVSTTETEMLLCNMMKAVGFSLSSPATPIHLDEFSFFSTNQGALLVCTEINTPLQILREMIASKPEMILFLDA
jgi:hypothetical protein